MSECPLYFEAFAGLIFALWLMLKWKPSALPCFSCTLPWMEWHRQHGKHSSIPNICSLTEAKSGCFQALKCPIYPRGPLQRQLQGFSNRIMGNICQRIWSHCSWVSWLSLGQRLLLQQKEIDDCTLNCSIASVHFVSLWRFLPFLSVTIKEELGNLRQGWHFSFLAAKCANNAECVLCALFSGDLPDGTATFPDTPPGLYSFQPYMGLHQVPEEISPHFLSLEILHPQGKQQRSASHDKPLDDFLLTQDHFSSGLSSSCSLKAAGALLWHLWMCNNLLPEVSVSSAWLCSLRGLGSRKEQ